MSPDFPKGTYTLEIVNTADSTTWTDKTKRIYGSDNTFVTLKGFFVFK